MKKYLLSTIFFLFLISSVYSQTTSFFKPVANSGYNNDHVIAIPATILPNIGGAQLSEGDEIGVFNSAGKCFGAIVWKKVSTTVIAKGMNLSNPIDGFLTSEIMRFRIYSKATKTAYYATVTWDQLAPQKDQFTVQGISALSSLRGTTKVSVASDKSDIPSKYNLMQNYPNPFNPSTQITFSVPTQSNVSVIIYDINGKEITRLLNSELKNTGSHQITWNGEDGKGKKVSSGFYFYKLEAFSLDNQSSKNVFSQVKSMLLAK
jgi:hypothetical protein